MRLEEWLKRENITETDFARSLGVDPSTITRLIPGPDKKEFRRPGWALMASIRNQTGGDVTPNDWLEAFEEKPTPDPAACLAE